MSKATEDFLSQLHGTLAQKFEKYLEETSPSELSASMVGQVVAFLKHNNIEVDMTDSETSEDSIMRRLREKVVGNSTGVH